MYKGGEEEEEEERLPFITQAVFTRLNTHGTVGTVREY